MLNILLGIVLWFSGHDVDNVVANVILGVIAEIKINNCFFINVIPPPFSLKGCQIMIV